MYAYEPPSATREWRTSQEKEIDWATFRKTLRTQHDEIEALFEIIKTQDDEIKELQVELAQHKATDLERHGWAGGSVSELKDRIDQLSYGLGIVEKKLDQLSPSEEEALAKGIEIDLAKLR